MTVNASWRDVLPVHPAADMFPLMSEPELRKLGEDIRKNGLRIPTIWWRDPSTRQLYLLDGRNRLDALEATGRNIISRRDGTGPGADLREILTLGSEYWYELREEERRGHIGKVYPDPYTYVISANVHRRHLTIEQKRELIAKLLKATPENSDRQIAESVKASPTTVGTVRAKMEATGDVSNLDTRRDTKGREQPARKTARKQVFAEQRRDEVVTATSKRTSFVELLAAWDGAGPNVRQQLARDRKVEIMKALQLNGLAGIQPHEHGHQPEEQNGEATQ